MTRLLSVPSRGSHSDASDSAGVHPVFRAFEDAAEGALIPNWLGARTRRSFFEAGLNFVTFTPPAPRDSEYFEWIDLLESVLAADGDYTMIELGAGYGRWTVNAAAAVRALGRSRYDLVAVEAEPTHFEWLGAHCADNDLGVDAEEGSLQLIHAAVTSHGDEVEFATGDPARWYGQAIADGTWAPEATVSVGSVRLSGLVADRGCVDLIHADIQGAELDVMAEAIAQLDEHVARLHIGTHNEIVEHGLRVLLGEHGWSALRDYSANSVAETPWGAVLFQDGVQTWVNPRREARA